MISQNKIEEEKQNIINAIKNKQEYHSDYISFKYSKFGIDLVFQLKDKNFVESIINYDVLKLLADVLDTKSKIREDIESKVKYFINFIKSLSFEPTIAFRQIGYSLQMIFGYGNYNKLFEIPNSQYNIFGLTFVTNIDSILSEIKITLPQIDDDKNSWNKIKDFIDKFNLTYKVDSINNVEINLGLVSFDRDQYDINEIFLNFDTDSISKYLRYILDNFKPYDFKFRVDISEIFTYDDDTKDVDDYSFYLLGIDIDENLDRLIYNVELNRLYTIFDRFDITDSYNMFEFLFKDVFNKLINYKFYRYNIIKIIDNGEIKDENYEFIPVTKEKEVMLLKHLHEHNNIVLSRLNNEFKNKYKVNDLINEAINNNYNVVIDIC